MSVLPESVKTVKEGNSLEGYMGPFLKGNAHYIAREYTEALRSYEKAIELGFPDVPELQQTMIDIGITMGIIEERRMDGMPIFKEMGDLEPEEYGAFLCLERVCERLYS